MKKNLLMFVTLILIVLASHYYGVHRGAKAATDVLTLELGMKAVDQMVLNSALLLSLKNEKSEQALKIAQQFVENDVKHLDKIEEMLEKLPLDEFDKNIFQISIVEARENHKLVNDL
ncbi:MAG: hypothetical protein MJK15_18415 [Colwellia sp.]|nr:hypothetical protein [Colwellia sp.]